MITAKIIIFNSSCNEVEKFRKKMGKVEEEGKIRVKEGQKFLRKKEGSPKAINFAIISFKSLETGRMFPPDILVLLFSHLRLSDLSKTSLVSKEWNILVHF